MDTMAAGARHVWRRPVSGSNTATPCAGSSWRPRPAPVLFRTPSQVHGRSARGRHERRRFK